MAVRVFLAILFTSFLFLPVRSSAAGAEESRRPSRAEVLREHHQMMQQMMGMVKELVGIVGRVSDSAAVSPEKELIRLRLDEISRRLEQMMSRHDALMKAMDESAKKPLSPPAAP